ncbi:hypothetical protein [Desulfovermiculus halophilus]|jgi:3-hydroxyacyl-[acyl-carrier-protein] dehydratase|uniref:hypothetical protein n=1 Tax=Desulfovermiculus halophilus TaxID=339722 RepID=UPI0005594C1F|nr:hypothetical protein [Desulfovermiculus halophilus]
MQFESETFGDRSIVDGQLCFNPQDPIYADHFPGIPVTPGSLIIQGFIQAARQSGYCSEVKGIEKFKFKRFAVPGRFRFQMRPDENRVHCTLLDSQSQVLATGVLII